MLNFNVKYVQFLTFYQGNTHLFTLRVTSCKSKYRTKGFYPLSPHHRPFKGGGLNKKFK